MLGFYQSPFVESVFMWRFLEIGINTSHLCLQILVVEVGQLLVVEAEVVSQADQQDHVLWDPPMSFFLREVFLVYIDLGSFYWAFLEID